MASLGGDTYANSTGELDEVLYCNEAIEWGSNCYAQVQCHGSVSGAVFIQHTVYPYYGSFLEVQWGFEYDPGNGNISALCEGWDTVLRAPWNPDFDMKCKGPSGAHKRGMARVHVDLSDCEFDWVDPEP
jgi:hypothetical protein